MSQVFIAKGNGYAGDTSFDGFDVIAEPCADHESRVFGRQENGNGGTCYRAYSLKLALRQGQHGSKCPLYLLVRHGAGTEVLAIPTFYDCGPTRDAILAMPERAQYGLLMTIYKTARDAKDAAREETRHEYAQAFVEKRLRKTRAKAGRCSVFIDPPAAIPA